MMKDINDIIKMMLNDKDIFDSPYDRESRTRLPKLFEKEEWERLAGLFERGEKIEFIDLIEKRKTQVINDKIHMSNWPKRKLKEKAENLQNSFSAVPELLDLLFKHLEWYGLVECLLPAMDDYGLVIERNNFEIATIFFMDKIKRQRNPRNSKALKKILQYVSELSKIGCSREKIGYIVRKVRSLMKYWEVLDGCH